MTTAKKLGAGAERIFGVDSNRPMAVSDVPADSDDLHAGFDSSLPKHKTHTSGLRKKVVLGEGFNEIVDESDSEGAEDFYASQITAQSRISMSRIMGDAIADGFVPFDTSLEIGEVGRYSIVNDQFSDSPGRYSFSEVQLLAEDVERIAVPAYKTIPPGMVDAEQRRILSSIPPELIDQPVVEVVESIRDKVMNRFKVLFPEKVEWWCSENPLIRVWGQLSTGLSVLTDEQLKSDVEGLMGNGFYWPDDTKAVRHYLENQIRNKFVDVDFDNILEKPVRKS